MAQSKIRTDYAHAALQRLEDSRLLIESRLYGGAIYYSGLSAEAMIKAFIEGNSGEIKGHNLVRLAQHANFARRLKRDVRDKVNAAISEAGPMWRNLFRYCSHDDLDRMAREWRIRFEVESKLIYYADLDASGLRLWSERMYNFASIVVQEGNLLWQSKKH